MSHDRPVPVPASSIITITTTTTIPPSCPGATACHSRRVFIRATAASIKTPWALQRFPALIVANARLAGDSMPGSSQASPCFPCLPPSHHHFAASALRCTSRRLFSLGTCSDRPADSGLCVGIPKGRHLPPDARIQTGKDQSRKPGPGAREAFDRSRRPYSSS